MIRSHPWGAWLAAGLFALAALFCVPRGFEAESLLSAADDPVAIADRGLAGAFDRTVAIREIEAALDAEDAELAQSFVELANDRSTTLPPELNQRVAKAVERANSAGAAAASFASGLITGEPKDMAGLAGTALGDLFVFGDVRDAVREGLRLATGEQADELILGLACVGIAVTAGTYATLGLGAPARVGLSVTKVARKTGQVTGGMLQWLGRSSREIVDLDRLRGALRLASLTTPAVAVRAAREAVKIEKAQGLVRLASDVGRVQAKAGTKAALDGLRIAEGPRDISRIARLADARGGKTRAILKTLGRGAIFLAVNSVNLFLWLLSAVVTVFGFCSACKKAAERATERYCERRRNRRVRQHERFVPVTAQA